MTEGVSYCLSGFLVREYGCRKYLFIACEGSMITTIDDMGEVKKPEEDDDGDSSLVNAQIIAVPQLDRYSACMICNAQVEPTIPPFGECTKCETMQRISFWAILDLSWYPSLWNTTNCLQL